MSRGKNNKGKFNNKQNVPVKSEQLKPKKPLDVNKVKSLAVDISKKKIVLSNDVVEKNLITKNKPAIKIEVATKVPVATVEKSDEESDIDDVELDDSDLDIDSSDDDDFDVGDLDGSDLESMSVNSDDLGDSDIEETDSDEDVDGEENVGGEDDEENDDDDEEDVTESLTEITNPCMIKTDKKDEKTILKQDKKLVDKEIKKEKPSDKGEIISIEIPKIAPVKKEKAATEKVVEKVINPSTEAGRILTEINNRTNKLSECSLYLMHMSHNTQVEDITKLLENVVHAFLPLKNPKEKKIVRGYGFLRFANVNDATKAMNILNQTTINGKTINVSKYVCKKSVNDINHVDFTHIVLTSFKYSDLTNQIKAHFSSCANVNAANIVTYDLIFANKGEAMALFNQEMVTIGNHQFLANFACDTNKSYDNTMIPVPTVLKAGMKRSKCDSTVEVVVTKKVKVEATQAAKITASVTGKIAKVVTHNKPKIITPNQPKIEASNKRKVDAPNVPKGSRPNKSMIVTHNKNVVTPNKPKVEASVKVKVVTPHKPSVMTPNKPDIVTLNKPNVVTPNKSDIVTLNKPKVATPNKPNVVTPNKPKVLTPNKQKVIIPNKPNVDAPNVSKVNKDNQPIVLVPNKASVVIPNKPNISTTEILLSESVKKNEIVVNNSNKKKKKKNKKMRRSE